MTRYAKRKLKYSLNENFNLLPYVEWDRFVTLTGAQAEWGLRIVSSLFTAQNTIHLEFNFSLLIFNQINYDHDWFATSGNPFCFFKLFLQTEKIVIFFKYIFRHRLIYTLRQKLNIYFYRYIFLHQYC